MTKDSPTAAISVVVTIAVVLLVGLTIFGHIYDTLPEIKQSVRAETFNSGEFDDYSYDEANATGQGPWVPLAHKNIIPDSEKVYNSTMVFEPSGNYTLNCTDGTISVLAESKVMYNNTDYNIDYNWKGISEMATKTAPVIGNAFTLASVLTIVMAAAVILSVLLKFGGVRR